MATNPLPLTHATRLECDFPAEAPNPCHSVRPVLKEDARKKLREEFLAKFPCGFPHVYWFDTTKGNPRFWTLEDASRLPDTLFVFGENNMDVVRPGYSGKTQACVRMSKAGARTHNAFGFVTCDARGTPLPFSRWFASSRERDMRYAMATFERDADYLIKQLLSGEFCVAVTSPDGLGTGVGKFGTDHRRPVATYCGDLLQQILAKPYNYDKRSPANVFTYP